MKKLVLVYGLIAGLIVAAMMAFTTGYYCARGDFEGGMIYGYSSMLLAFSMIFVATKLHRDKQNGGVISFGKAFRIGFLITLIAATIYVITWLVIYYNFQPDFMDKYAAAVLREAQASGASATELAEKTAEMEKYKEWYKNPLFVTGMTYVEILPVGLVVSLITALLLKRSKPKGEKVQLA